MTVEDPLSVLTAGLAEDEALAAVASVEYQFESWTARGDSVDTVTAWNVAHPVPETYNDGVAVHVAHHDPARTLRQVQAVRRVVDLLDEFHSFDYNDMDNGEDLRIMDGIIEALASIYTEPDEDG